MFSNGTEYLSFLEKYCLRCKKYVDYLEETEENPCCPIEEKLSLCSITGDKEDWPQELQRNSSGFYECTQFERDVAKEFGWRCPICGSGLSINKQNELWCSKNGCIVLPLEGLSFPLGTKDK